MAITSKIVDQAHHWLSVLKAADFVGGVHDQVAKELSEHAYGLPIAAHIMMLLECSEGPLQMSMLSTALANEAVRKGKGDMQPKEPYRGPRVPELTSMPFTGTPFNECDKLPWCEACKNYHRETEECFVEK